MKKLLALVLALLCLCSVAFAEVNTATVIPAQEGDITLDLENGSLPLTVYMMNGEYHVRLNGPVRLTKALKNDIGYWQGGPNGWRNFATKPIGDRFATLRYLVQGDSIYVICTWATKLEHSNYFTDEELIVIAKVLIIDWEDMEEDGSYDGSFADFLRDCGLTRYEITYILDNLANG